MDNVLRSTDSQFAIESRFESQVRGTQHASLGKIDGLKYEHKAGSTVSYPNAEEVDGSILALADGGSLVLL